LSDRILHNFLAELQEILQLDPGVQRTESVFPPEWSKLGWRVGWVIGENYTEIQFLLTEEEHWPILTESWGTGRTQKQQVFSERYSKLLRNLAAELGKPLSLESLKWRKVDLGAFPGREEIEKQRWWRIDFESRRMGTWNFIVPDRFYGLFDHEDSVVLPEPPWEFSELWKTLSDTARRQLLEQLGLRRQHLNHLAGLVACGNLDSEFIGKALARNPGEEFEQALIERKELLQSKSGRAQKRIQNRWKKHANRVLAETTGQLLEDEILSGSLWETRLQEWKDYRQTLREARYGISIWMKFWKQFSDEQLKQMVPRLNDSLLADASVQLPSSFRENLATHARPELARKLREDSPSISREQVFKAREKLANHLEEWSQQFGVEWEWA